MTRHSLQNRKVICSIFLGSSTGGVGEDMMANSYEEYWEGSLEFRGGQKCLEIGAKSSWRLLNL